MNLSMGLGLVRRARPRRPRFLLLPKVAVGENIGVAAAVFALPGDVRGRDSWLAVVIAAAVMVALAAAARAVPERAVVPAPQPKLVVELFEAPKPPPPPEVPPPAPAKPPPPARAPSPRAVPQAAAPAQAAAVVAQEAPAEEALDLTSFSIATGSGPQYAGGKTASSGTSTKAVTGAVAADGVPDGTGDLSQGVRLVDDEWECPWPAEAEALGIDEQTVVLRVVVGADGRMDSAGLIQDPGQGFGRAALVCARQSRFEPARGPDGTPVRARSGPIRVRFTR